MLLDEETFFENKDAIVGEVLEKLRKYRVRAGARNLFADSCSTHMYALFLHRQVA